MLPLASTVRALLPTAQHFLIGSRIPVEKLKFFVFLYAPNSSASSLDDLFFYISGVKLYLPSPVWHLDVLQVCD